ncbi:hypothetical protein COCCU_04380 [Corynebacterium occultum]|uniref:Uncharacterized protein n=1 Tax=Corynebacterium occultum TaxID=2675219 RepID=A0A6B8VZZ9_9CORY|nr:hypothetical protein [Corynebacterium occultum]QGU06824.1 hypothetical protein COCCU_04380 [Corynebacterium occultum]
MSYIIEVNAPHHNRGNRPTRTEIFSLMNARKFPPPPPEHLVDDSSHPRILSPIDIYLDTESARSGLFTMAFVFSFSKTQSPRSLLLSHGQEEKPGEVWVEADDPEHGFHATGVHWEINGLLLRIELTDGHTFHWNGQTSVTVELMESRALGVNTCLEQIFAEPDEEISDLVRRQRSSHPEDSSNLEQ